MVDLLAENLAGKRLEILLCGEGVEGCRRKKGGR